MLLIACLLVLCGCGATKPDTGDVTGSDHPPSDTQTDTQTPDPAPVPEKVTVYLLEKDAMFDSGEICYIYDENYNIDSCKATTIENEIRYNGYFEEKDANGMAAKYRIQWPDGESGDIRVLTYFADGKLKEDLVEGSNFTGFQYEYDRKGDRAEKREYYEGILETVTYYEYDGETLSAVYAETKEGDKVFECRIQDGRITEKVCYEADGSSYSYLYAYDTNGNLIQTSFVFEGETLPCDIYTYKAVEVDADRAYYLQAQQAYLLDIV